MMWFEILLLVVTIGVLIFVWGLLAVGLFDFADYMTRRREAKRKSEAFVPFHDLLG